MKQLVDGKVCNTETATQIATWSNGLNSNDFNLLCESLYKTKKGVLFLFAKGGASTWCAARVGNSRTAGVKFMSFSEQDAIEWAEQRCIDPDLISIELNLEEA